MSTAGCTPAWTGRGRSTPPTRACGCRAAAAGSSPSCATYYGVAPGVVGRLPRAAWTSWREYCINREAGDRMYFTVTAEGKPLRQRRYYFSEGVLRPGQRRVLRRHRGQGVPGAGPKGLQHLLGSEPRPGQGPHRPGTQDHPRDPLRPGLRPDPMIYPERHRRAAAGWTPSTRSEYDAARPAVRR